MYFKGYKTKMKVLLRLIFFLLLTWSVSAEATEKIGVKEAENWANHKGNQILQILADTNLERKYKALDEIFYKDIDLDHAAKFAVGKYWRKMSSEQQKQYVPLFKQYINSIYKGYPLNFGEGEVSFSVAKVLPSKSGVDVWCVIKLKAMQQVTGQEQSGFNVLFALVKNGGVLQVRDLKIGESSLLLAFRDRFYKMIYNDNDEEIDWFLEDLQTITADNEEKNQQNLDSGAF